MAYLREAASRRWIGLVIAAAALAAACHPQEEQVAEAVQSVTASQEGKLLASDAITNDVFGTSVAISGDAAIVGALNHALDTGQGAAYVFRRAGTTWTEEQILGPPATSSNSAFGISVAISGDTAVVGAYADGTNAGSAFVFERSNGTWLQTAKLNPMDAAPADAFGLSVAIEGDTAVVGAPWKLGSRGAAYVFVRAGLTWVQQAKIVAPTPQLNAEFGHAVAISGDTVVIGADRASVVASESGAAFVFARTGADWIHNGTLSASDGGSQDFFGYAVSVRGTTAIVGAINNSEKGLNAGAAYVYERAGGTWAQQAKLVSATAKSSENFGRSVSLGKDSALIGAPFVNNHGAAYVFTRAGAAWTQALAIAPADSGMDDRLAETVALSGSTAILGTIWNDTAAVDAGAAYIFALQGITGSACASAAECASGFCAGGVCCDAACSGACETCSQAGGAIEDGTCTPVAGGAACDDGNGCTQNDVCTGGVCAGTAITCTAPDACHEVGTCTSGPSCDYANKPDGTVCPGGACAAGVCTPTMTGTGGSATGGSGGATTTTTTTGEGGGPVEEPKEDGGCGCRAAGSDERGAAGLFAVMAAMGLAARRRRRG